ncbi:adenosine deaminase [Rhizobium grahamii]|uniref:Adenine deaminase n=1 Tax=Rhizobium grahamii TaxID=1120045 RepID=A0A5Q0C9J5_9HYPH|nr:MULTISPECIES: adenosine deaminase [Rhizobium]QFY61995.1 adenosine deaminase [Rhizobium grahamii]QRM48829.1 adenosine deaminase [Rhizobium sp. BG6]
MTRHLKKVELHCHLEGAAPPSLTLAQARKYNIDIAAYLKDGAYVWHDFASFLQCYDKISEVYKTEEDYALLTETYLGELASVGTIYSELIVSPDHGKRIGLGADAYIAGVCEGIRRAEAANGIVARLIVTGERHFGPDSVVGAAEYAAKARNPLITGFNLAGEERMGRVADYARAFDIARDAGLGLTIHAGEVCGPFSVADALDVVRPSRIGHGVRAIEDEALVRRLAEQGTVLEVCPGSNIALKVFPDFAAHPLRRLKEAGVRVTISSDDPPFFHTSLEREYELAASAFGFTDSEIDELTRTGLEAAFVDEETRKVLLARL